MQKLRALTSWYDPSHRQSSSAVSPRPGRTPAEPAAEAVVPQRTQTLVPRVGPLTPWTQRQTRQRVTEEFFDLSTPTVGDLVNPFITLTSGLSMLFPLFPIRRLSPGFSNYIYLTQPQTDVLRWFGRLSYELNEYAQAGLTQLANYTIGPGYTYDVAPIEGETASESLLKQVTRYLRKFREKNCWEDLEWERDLYISCRRDGDVFVRFYYDDETGIPRLTKYLGEEVRDEKFFTPEWSMGVLTSGRDLVTPKGWQVWSRTEDLQRTEVLQPYEMIRFMNHLSPENKRGLTDFFAIRDVLDEAKKLLRSGRIGETARQAIAYVTEYDLANQGEVQGAEAANTNTTTQVTGPGGPPQFMQTGQITPGEVHSLPGGIIYKEGPTGDAIPVELLVKASLRACAAKWNIPLNLLDGEIDSNFAAAVVEEGPLTKRIQVDQNTSKRRYVQIMKRAIYYGIQWGLLPSDTLERVDILVECPPIIPRDAEGETNRNQILVQNRVMSRRTWAAREGLEFDAEQEQIQAEDEMGISAAVEEVGDEEEGAGADTKGKSETAAAEYAREIKRPKGDG